ncbi:glycine radical domain-containing protein [Deltaproteobacteria bacterium TL4]
MGFISTPFEELNLLLKQIFAPLANEPHEKKLELFTNYLQTYFNEGGMQWQFNVISTEMLRDAMENPDDYRWLLVRISGYNAYFVKLNRNMQIELIERQEFHR